jgi:hypothetical protein
VSKTASCCTVKYNVGNLQVFYSALSTGGAAVAQLVEALHYKPEAHGFDS